ncbi:tyrosine-protein kinase hopscotch [Anoplophora glabripennis]|nr:tyrosine-protein kinase hopscotch [Anoplophora glabripennis]
MGDSALNVNIVLENKSISVPYDSNTTAEDVCIYVCKQLNIATLTRNLFALRVTGKSIYLMPAATFTEKGSTNVDFRIRFKVANVSKLEKLDINTYNYYFHQARSDVLENKIPDIVYEKYRRELVGLGITDMYRVMLEKGISRESVESDYKKFIPKDVLKRYPFFIRKPIHDTLSKLRKSGYDASYVKAEYLRQLQNIAPEYLSECYKAVIDQKGSTCSITIKVSPYDSSEPGLKYCMDSKKEEWYLICTIDELGFISIRNDGTIEISRKNGIPFYLKFHSIPVMYSFISLLDGYYRLTCKWTFNICKEVITPSLQKLHAMKCHGPVGGEFSYAKLESKRGNRAGCFILRESESKYNSYYIDVCMKEGLKPKTFKLEKITGDEFIFNDDLTRYKSIQQLMMGYNDPNKAIFLQECLPPSEYDVSPLLLCKSENIVGDSLTDSSNVNALMPSSPTCINCKNLQVYKGQRKEGFGGKTVVFRSMWKVTKGKKIEVAMKMLKQENPDNYLKEFLTLAGQWAFLQSSAIVRLYGIAFTSSISMVLEYFRLGPLDQYLQANRGIMKTVDLIEAASNLAAALWHLAENDIVHGNIRCRKLLVSTHDDNSFTVKLADPGIFTQYSSSEIHWIPVECYSNFNFARRSIEADVWAFATTLWEMFTCGDDPNEKGLEIRAYISGKRLPQPEKCLVEIYDIMKECWDIDPHKRKKPQAISRDINQILYQVFNSRQKHSYAKIGPKFNDLGSSTNSLRSSRTVSTVLIDNLRDNEMSSESSYSLKDLNDESYDWSHFLSPLNLSTATTSLDSLNSMQSVLELDGNYDVVLKGRIGQGFYGEVYRASLESVNRPDEKPRKVAVKKLKATALSSCIQDFEREINIMKALNHPNIVEILGVLREPEVSLVMEFVQHGSLQSYLKINKEKLEDGQLLKYALDIAKGMDYLGTKNIVHRDLAARNILVVDDNHVKISDFGLAQVMGTNDYYILKTPNRELPIKWYSPESLRDGKFSVRSDVWSYGVTMCEMFNYGDEPNLANIDEEIEGQQQQVLLNALEKGARFPCPPNCPKVVYIRIIYPCWEADPHSRPPFAKLVLEIEDLLTQ